MTEVAFASALARASIEDDKYIFVMKTEYVEHGDSFAASKAGRISYNNYIKISK